MYDGQVLSYLSFWNGNCVFKSEASMSLSRQGHCYSVFTFLIYNELCLFLYFSQFIVFVTVFQQQKATVFGHPNQCNTVKTSLFLHCNKRLHVFG